MHWFGEWSDCELGGKVEAPVGAVCEWCGERIAASDSGVIFAANLIEHRECFRRAVLGSIAHLERRCSCSVPGSEENDPPGMSKRAAAKLVDEWAEGNPHWRRSGGKVNPE
jgi:hypothetical protein